MTQLYEEVKTHIRNELHKESKLSMVFIKAEKVSGVQREYIFYGGVGVLALYLIAGNLAQLMCNLIGMAYPAYASILAIQSVDKIDDTQWLIYWVIFATFSLADTFSANILNWLPFYWLLKCACFLWLYLPFTMGAQKVYRLLVASMIGTYRKTIEEDIKSVKAKVIAKAVQATHEAQNGLVNEG